MNAFSPKALIFCILAISLLLLASCQKDSKTSSGSGKFVKLTPDQTGIDFSNDLKEDVNFSFLTFHYIYNGGGVAAGDINNDGLTDLFFTGNQVNDRLYLNKGGFKFEDITASSGITDVPKGWNTGVVMVDINNDGYQDIYVCRGASTEPVNLRKNLLFVNQKNNTFKEEAAQYGIDDDGYSIMAVFFDYDNDNDLDLVVSNRPDRFSLTVFDVLEGRKNGASVNKIRLYNNDGSGKFKDVSKESGFGESYGYGLGVAVADLNGDGYQDIYFANDFTENDYCFLNQGGKSFKESIRQMTNHTAFYAMGTDISDINNDGLEDILTVEMLPDDYWRSKVSMSPMVGGSQWDEFFTSGRVHVQYMQNMLQLNRGNGFFSDIAQYAGLKSTDWSWAVLAFDLDNDGWRDVFISNGYRRDVFDNDAIRKADKQLEEEIKKANSTDIPPVLSLLDNYPAVKLVNYVFKNNGDLTFSKKMEDWGITDPSWSQGSVLADLDNDGDLDLVVSNLDEQAFVYQNEIKSGNYLRIKLDGPAQNKQGLGAKVEVYCNNHLMFEQFKVVRGYQSSVEPILHFGCGDADQADSIKVNWLDGTVTRLGKTAVNQLLTISHSGAAPVTVQTSEVKTLFSDQTDALLKPGFTHRENVHNDFYPQVLLPHRLSMEGPCVAVGDVNGDQMDDFYVGGAKGQTGVIYLQSAEGSFLQKTQVAFEKDKEHEDTGAAFFDADGDGDSDLYVVSGGTERPINYDYYQDRLYLNDGKGNFQKSDRLPKIGMSGSVVRPLDFDADGDLDLFVGGRTVPDYYPLPPNSFILRNDGGKFTDVSTEVAPSLTKLGMVTDALVTDLNMDQKPDIVMVGEWLPITILLNEGGKFAKDTSLFKVPRSVGWWNRITEADVNGDGEKDFILGNIGKNYKFQPTPEKPLELYANDFDGNSTMDVFLAKHLKDKVVPIRGRQCSSEQLPDVVKNFPTFRDFASANIDQILGDKISTGLHLKADHFASVMLIRKGNSFEQKLLPVEAQFSAVKGILTDDFNGDGHLDILTGGNWYASEYETQRADQSIGELFAGDGKGGYHFVAPKQSGVFIPFDVRELIPIKVGPSKRKAFIAAVNNMPLRLFVLN